MPHTPKPAIRIRIDPPLSNRALNTLFADAWPSHQERDFQPLLKSALVYAAAYSGDRIIGFAKVVGDGGIHGFLLDPTVTPDFQKQGTGKALIERCVNESKARGVEWLHVDFEPQLKPFYEACGFSSTQAGLMNLRS